MPPSIDVEADDDASVGDQRAVGALIVADLKAAFDHGHRTLSVRQNGHDLRPVDQLGAGHADVDVDDHRIQRLAERRRN
jgi:hypothetical protein